MTEISQRFEKLKELREKLCKQSDKWNEYFALHKWLVDNLKDIIAQGKSDKIKKEDIINSLEDLLCVIESEDEDDE